MRALAIIVVLVVALVPALAHAEIDAKGVRVGLATFGVDIELTQPNQQGSDGTHGPPSLFWGAFITSRFTPSFALQLEGVFAMMNSQVEHCGSTPACINVHDLWLYYIELPVLIRLDLLPGERSKFHLDVGPELAIHLGSVDKVAKDEAIDLKPLNFGVVVGLGFEVGAGPGRITIDARYKRWAIPLRDGTETIEKITTDHQVMLAVGYAFP